MSSFVYGAVTRKREQADKDASTKDQPPGLQPYVDAVAALVPAEVLAAHSAIMSAAVKTAHPHVKTGHGHKTHEVVQSTFTRPGTHWGLIFAGLCVLSMGLYAAGHLQGSDWKKLANPIDIVRVFIPPAAFVLWTIGQKGSMFYALHPSLGRVDRAAIVVILGVALPLVAGLLGVRENRKPKRTTGGGRRGHGHHGSTTHEQPKPAGEAPA